MRSSFFRKVILLSVTLCTCAFLFFQESRAEQVTSVGKPSLYPSQTFMLEAGNLDTDKECVVVGRYKDYTVEVCQEKGNDH